MTTTTKRYRVDREPYDKTWSILDEDRADCDVTWSELIEAEGFETEAEAKTVAAYFNRIGKTVEGEGRRVDQLEDGLGFIATQGCDHGRVEDGTACADRGGLSIVEYCRPCYAEACLMEES